MQVFADRSRFRVFTAAAIIPSGPMNAPAWGRKSNTGDHGLGLSWGTGRISEFNAVE